MVPLDPSKAGLAVDVAHFRHLAVPLEFLSTPLALACHLPRGWLNFMAVRLPPDAPEHPDSIANMPDSSVNVRTVL